MKRLISLIFLSVVTNFAYSQQVPGASDLKKLNWLTGTWNRTNAKPGQSGIERWIKDASGKLVGKGITLRGSDTIFVETLAIIAKGKQLYYTAAIPGNSAQVAFKFTVITATSFVCENAANDFPKKIAYYLAKDGTVKATISGGGRSVDYLFTKKK